MLQLHMHINDTIILVSCCEAQWPIMCRVGH